MWQHPPQQPGFPFNVPGAGFAQGGSGGAWPFGGGPPPSAVPFGGPYGTQAAPGLPPGFPAWMAQAAGMQAYPAGPPLAPPQVVAPAPMQSRSLSPATPHGYYPAPAQPPPASGAAPAEAAQAPAPAAAAAGGRKKALIIAVSYLGTSSELRGPLTDAQNIRGLLRDRLGFHPDDIVVLWEDAADPQRPPTHSNIVLGLRWLVSDLHQGDSLVLFYSGHGTQQLLPLGQDEQGRECVQVIQALVPLDFRDQGLILDTELNRLLVNPLPAGVKLTAFLDACHCGTMLELPYRATVARGHAKWEVVHEERPDRGTAGGFAVLFSSCGDQQTSADTGWFTQDGRRCGAATFCFLGALRRRGLGLSYEQLLVEMAYTCKEELAVSQDDESTRGYQDVHMSASFAFDLDAPFSL